MIKCNMLLPILIIFGIICGGHSEIASNIQQIKSLLPTDLRDEPPTVLIALMVRNKAHILPYVLSYIEQQNYPKNRLALW